MRRCRFIALLGGAAASWPLKARGQQTAVPLIGYLGSSTASIDRPRLAAFLKRLGELGWVKDRNVRIETIVSDYRSVQDIESAIESLKGRTDALYVCADPLIITNQNRINELILNARLSAIHGLPEIAASGGLVAYGADIPDMCRRAAEIVDRILHTRRHEPGTGPICACHHAVAFAA
jgi:hypothetical protein